MARDTKVGSGWVEVDYRVDVNKAMGDVSRFKAMAERMANIEGKIHLKVDNVVRTLHHVTQRLDNDSNHWGRTMGRNLVRGIDAAISLLPGRMESLFSGKGGPIGLAIGAAIVAGVAGVMPAIGAMMSGAIFAGFGVTAVAAGIALVAKDPRVTAAAQRLKDMFHNEIWDSTGAEAYVQAVVPALDRVTVALQRWAPLINSMLHASSAFIQPLTTGLIGFVDGFIGPMERMMNSPFMTGIMTTFSAGLKQIGDAFGYLFDRFLNDADAQEGALLGLQNLFGLLSDAIRMTVNALIFLTSTWAHWNEKGEGGLSFMDRVRGALGFVGQAISFVAGLIMGILRPAFDVIVAIIRPMLPILAAIALAIGGALVTAARAAGQALEWFANFLRENPAKAEVLAAAIGAVVAGFVAWKVAVIAWTVAKQVGIALQAAWNAVMLVGKGIMLAVRGVMIAWTAVQWALNAAMYANPIGLVVLAIAALVAAIIWVVTHLQLIKDTWNAVWGWIKAHAIAWWNNMFAFLSGWGQNVVNWWNNTINFFKEIWNSAWGWIKDHAIAWWNNMFAFLSGWGQNIVNWWNNVLTFFRDLAHNIWLGIQIIIGTALDWIHGKITVVLNFIKGLWETIWTNIKDFAHNLWVGIQFIIGTAIDWIQAKIDAVMNFIKGLWERIWTNIKDFAHNLWVGIQFIVETSINWVRDKIESVMNTIRNIWNTIWEGIKNVLGGIWSGITDAVKAGLNFVIDLLNKGIRGINGILEKLNISFRIGEIPRLATGGPVTPPAGDRSLFHAQGGRIFGPGSGTSDSIPAYLSNGEYVIRKAAAMRLGYRNLAYMNSTGGFPGNYRYAVGGRVGAGNNALLEQHRDHVHVAMNQGWQFITQMAARSGLPFRVTSTVRPGDRVAGGGLSHHATGRAVDFGGFNQDAFASYWEKLGGVIELIHRTNIRDYAIFGGKGGGGGLMDLFSKGIGWVMDTMINPLVNGLLNEIPGGHLVGEMGKGVIIMLRDEIKKLIQAFMDSMSPIDGGGMSIGAALGAARWTGTAMTALRMLGLPGSWLGPLLNLIQRESGGNPNAINRWDSNAARGTPSMGLMQTIGPTFAAHMYPGMGNILDPLSNILAGLRYIMARYGSIFNVQQAVGSTPRGYRKGGWLMPGGLAYNETDEPEAVFNKSQLNAMGGTNIGELHVHVYGNVSDAEAKRIALKVRDELVKIGRRNGGKTGLPSS